MLVHGMAGSWQSWLLNLEALGEHHRVIAVDLPGFGGSEPLPAGADFSGYVTVLRCLLDELEIESVAVFGHSLGGLVALSFAAARPERTACLVLVSAGGVELSRPRLWIIRAAFWLVRLVLLTPRARQVLVRSVVGRLALSPAVHRWRDLPSELVAQMVPRAIGPGFMEAVRLGTAQLRRLAPERVDVPVLLFWGERDRILPLAAGRSLVACLERARLVVLDDVGHCAMFEAADEFNALALDFLAEQQAADAWTKPDGGRGKWIRRYTDRWARYGDGNLR
ncbi:alpha/beta fold hydrolase [Nocardioides sp. WS12]|uniref:alpha/beta fold hydrolase n=1 Tax=Nocardioides sp. WS12 TaxID=2486272 RepID=UPI0023518D7A|nr:alpha/beta fold hydrolase [Nocardioides sp. WS12]